jgi:GTP-binding protein HflX
MPAIRETVSISSEPDLQKNIYISGRPLESAEVDDGRRRAVLFVRYREETDAAPPGDPKEGSREEVEGATARPLGGESAAGAPEGAAAEAASGQPASLVEEPPQPREGRARGRPIAEDALPVAARELAALLRGLGIAPVAVVHRRRTPGRGGALGGDAKIDELAAAVRAHRGVRGEAPLIVVDGELRPGPRRAIAAATGAEVIDRTDVILRVFAARARTRIARCEVELAQIAYALPQLRDDASMSDAEGGGGRGAKGHSNLTLRKERLLERRAKLGRELEGLRRVRATQRARREELPGVALVGYTNAGKSSLMRALTGGDVGVDDRLFATIDATIRRLRGVEGVGGPPVLIADTVGFIRDLPHGLVESFRSTLAEAREADLLLHVVDVGDPERAQQIAVTREVLAEIGAGEVPTLLVLNKADRLDAAARAAVRGLYPDALLLSAHDPAGVEALVRAILSRVDGELAATELLVPYVEAGLLGELYAEARVDAVDFAAAGIRVELRADAAKLAAWRGRLAAAAAAAADTDAA